MVVLARPAVLGPPGYLDCAKPIPDFGAHVPDLVLYFVGRPDSFHDREYTGLKGAA